MCHLNLKPSPVSLKYIIITVKKCDAMAFILIDLIGIKELLTTNRAETEKICQDFWEQCKARSLYDDDNYKYVTFSDSLLISCNNDRIRKGKAFIDWASELYWEFKNICSCDMYMIINAGDEVKPSLSHDILPVTSGSNISKPNYINIAGFGSDFSDLYKADEEIRKRRKSKSLNNNFRIYINESLLDKTPTDTGNNRIKFNGLYGDEVVFYGFSVYPIADYENM